MLFKAEQLAQQLDRICKSKGFANFERGKALLRYMVDSVLFGHLDNLKETVIGVDVFGKKADYNTRTLSNVRVEARTLRQRLTAYYEVEGRGDDVLIELNAGSYVPAIYAKNSGAHLSNEDAHKVLHALTAMDLRTLPGYEKALDFLVAVLAHHPNDPRILSLIAMVHCFRPMYGLFARPELERAEQLIKQVHAMGAAPWECHFAEASVQACLHKKWPLANDAYQWAIALSEGKAEYHPAYTAFLASQGQLDEAIAIQESALNHLAHNAPITRIDLAALLIFAGRFAEAEDMLRSTLDLFSPRTHYLAIFYLAILHEAQGDFKGASALINKVPLITAESTSILGMKPLMEGLSGNKKYAREGLESLKQKREKQFIPACQLAIAALGAGDESAAVQWLTQGSMVECDPLLIWINRMPFLRHLYKNDSFRQLVTDKLHLKLPA